MFRRYLLERAGVFAVSDALLYSHWSLRYASLVRDMLTTSTASTRLQQQQQQQQQRGCGADANVH